MGKERGRAGIKREGGKIWGMEGMQGMGGELTRLSFHPGSCVHSRCCRWCRSTGTARRSRLSREFLGWLRDVLRARLAYAPSGHGLSLMSMERLVVG